jgi:hypothetical protein
LKNEFEKNLKRKKKKTFPLSSLSYPQPAHLSLPFFSFGPQPSQASRPFSFSSPREQAGPSWPKFAAQPAQHVFPSLFFCACR